MTCATTFDSYEVIRIGLRFHYSIQYGPHHDHSSLDFNEQLSGEALRSQITLEFLQSGQKLSSSDQPTLTQGLGNGYASLVGRLAS
jgi:hypothetical protein